MAQNYAFLQLHFPRGVQFHRYDWRDLNWEPCPCRGHRSSRLTSATVCHLTVLNGDSDLIEKSLSSPDCNTYPDIPVCKTCNDSPYQTVCVQLFDANSQYSFCPKICDVDSEFGFCNPPSETSD